MRRQAWSTQIWSTRPGIRLGHPAALVVAGALLLTSCATLAGPAAATQPVSSAPQAGASADQASGAIPGTPKTVQAATSAQRWALTYDQEFNGAVRQPAGWIYPQGGDWGQKTLMYTIPANAATNGAGHLLLTARKGGSGYMCSYGPCKYTSARMQTQGIFSQKYGKFEARIKLPVGHGLWPAFWMLPTKGKGEIDIIEENNQHPKQIQGIAHMPGLRPYEAISYLNKAVSDNYHIFGVVWTPKGITWTVDGHAYGHFAWYPGWPFSKPFYLILDLYVGGNWPGSPTAATHFPASMSIDWVHVYRRVG